MDLRVHFMTLFRKPRAYDNWCLLASFLSYFHSFKIDTGTTTSNGAISDEFG